MASLTWRLIATAVLINFAGLFQFGYFLSIYNQPSLVIANFINCTQHYKIGQRRMSRIWSLTMAMLNAGMAAGTIIGFLICQRIGRKPCLLYSAALGCIGAVVQTLSRPSSIYQLIAVGRFVSGLSIGMSAVVVPLFGTEVSPKKYRGAIGCTCSTAFAVGNLVANIAALSTALGNQDSWHYLPLFILIFTLTVLISFGNFPETPTYLMSTEAGLTKIGASLHFYHGRMSPFEYSKTLSELEQECVEGSAVPLSRMVKERHYQKAILVTVAMACANAFHGTAAIYVYLSFIVRLTGMTDTNWISAVSLLFPATDVLFSIPSFFLMEKVGRRPLVIGGNWVLTTCLFVISITLIIPQVTSVHSPAIFYVFLVFLLVDIASISIGVAKANWFMNTEMFPVQSRPVFTMVNSLTQNLLNMIMSAAFLPLNDDVGAYSFLILFAVPMLFFTIFLTVFTPETRQLTVTEVLNRMKSKPKIPTASLTMSDKGANDLDDEDHDNEETIFGPSKYGSVKRVR